VYIFSGDSYFFNIVVRVKTLALSSGFHDLFFYA